MSNGDPSESFDNEMLAETESYFVWRSKEQDEYAYHLELGGVSLHMTSEEWEELVELMKAVP